MTAKPIYMSASDVRRAFLEFFREHGAELALGIQNGIEFDG